MRKGWGKNPWIWIVWALTDALLVAAGWMYPVKLTGFLLLQAGAILWGEKRKKDWLWLGTGVIMGTMAEATAVAGGAWNYPGDYILGLPLWLPILWGMAALLGRRVVEEWK